MNNSKILGLEDDQMKCPLSGAAKALTMLDDTAMIVIGTEECTYYTKSSISMKIPNNNCFSVVLDNHDITFGCVDKVENAINELMEDYSPSSIFLVTTCVVEIIGDDFISLAKQASEQYNIPVKVIRTNHFTNDTDKDGFNSVMKEASTFRKTPNKSSFMLNMLKQKMSKKDKNFSKKEMKSKFGKDMSKAEMIKMINKKMRED